MNEHSKIERENSSPEQFVTTRWSLVLGAVRSDSTRARAALETLCRAYWYPLYVFVRRLGNEPADAEDIVQSFFERCLEKKYFAAADQAKGRFRSFLLVMLKRFMANEWQKQRARKRGQGQIPVALDALTPEERYAQEPANDLTPEKLYERRWALTLLENVFVRLREEQAGAGKLASFEVLKDCLATGERMPSYAESAARLNMTEGAVKVAVHRLRRRYRELLEDEIAGTVASPAEVNEERRYLLSVLSR